MKFLNEQEEECLWVQFACASMASGADESVAAPIAGVMVDEFRKRFGYKLADEEPHPDDNIIEFPVGEFPQR